MSYTWYLVITVIAAFMLLRPKDTEMTMVYSELQLRRLWLFFRIYPQYQLTRFRFMFMIWRLRYNRNNHPSKTK